jgi:uncharacterized iron-regulated protein
MIMKITRTVVFSAALIGALSFFCPARPNNDVLRVGDGKHISFDRMIREASKADIVFVGEVHDRMEHHRNELDVIKALHKSDAALVIGLEMFRVDSDKALNGWIDGSLSLDEFLPVYYDNWREPWPYYRGIFSYLRERRIPAIGLNIPDTVAEAVLKKGFASLSREQKSMLPSEISCDVDPTYMSFIRKAYASHRLGGDKQFLNFCEAQLIWDKAMAWNLVRFLNKNPGKKVVVLCGVGHAWRRGIPEQVAKLSKYSSRVIMPRIPDQTEPGSVTTGDADYVVLR